MKKVITIAAALLVLLGLITTGGYLWWNNQLSIPAVQSDTPPVSFVIPPGQSTSVTIDKLYEQGLIRNKIAAKIYLRLSKLDKNIRPGDYVIEPYTTMPGIFTDLSSGPQDVWVTIPEGWRREQIAVRLHNVVPSIDPGQFIVDTALLEGQLFPDTYLIPAMAVSSDAVRILTSNFKTKTNLDAAKSYEIDLDGETFSLTGMEILTFASLVEREANSEIDRPMVAGILLRRYLAEWPLQVDASLQYAVGTQRCLASPLDCDYWRPITDTSVNSAYNTYTHPGLPPSPIANPGLSVIKAVQNPQTSPYWYYLTGNDGVTYYAKTLPEHNRNIDKYLKS